MSLTRSAQLNGHDPNAYLKDILTRVPTHKASDIAALLPHRVATCCDRRLADPSRRVP
nr:transposase domain-containing protein [Paraburkholderia dioscoreae]